MAKPITPRQEAGVSGIMPLLTNSGRKVSTPVLACLVLSTMAFGGARIHAGTFETAWQPQPQPQAERQTFTTRVIDFAPITFQPSAFADWHEQTPRVSGSQN